MTNRIVLSGGANCQAEMVGGKRRKYHKKSMKRRGSRKSKAMRKSRRHSRKMMKRGGSRKSKAMRKSRKSRRSRGKGTWSCVVKGRRCTRVKRGSRKSRRGGSRKSRGAGMVQRAALPFGLLALQKMMDRRKSRKSLKKFGKRVLKAPYRTAKFLL